MDLKKALARLNSIDAKDLKNLDLSKLKDYNFGRFKDDLASKPNIIINCILVLITGFSVLYAVSSYRVVSKDVRAKEVLVTARLDMIQQKNAAEQAYDAFRSKFPEAIPTNQLIGRISEFAEEAHINIVSFSPVKASESEYITQYVINLDVEAKGYQDMVKFVHIVENAPFTLRINKWTGRSQTLRYQGQKDIPLGAYLEIGSITLNGL